MKKGSLFIVSAPSGAGKTTLCREVCRLVPDLRHSVSHTTRKPRIGEADGRDYFFVSQERFQEMIKDDEFVEWAEVHGNLYGTSIKRLEAMREGCDVILDIDTQGVAQIRRRYGEGIYIFILPPSMKVLEERLRMRMSEGETEIKQRLNKAREEAAEYKEYEYIIINNDLSHALSELKSIIISERKRTERFDPELVKKIINREEG